MDKKTMDKELDELVGDSGFLRYHAEYAKRREFNAFDVLRYAEYEIRQMDTKKWGPWLFWDLEEAEAWGSDGSYIRWGIDFQFREVRVFLEVPPYGRGEMVNRILAFMRETPVDRRHRDRYPMKSGEYNYFSVYSHPLVGDDILSGRSTAAVTEAVRREVENFLDSEDSDYKRIRDYFKCLAFPHDAAAGEEGAST